MIVEENVLGWNNIPVKTDEVIYPQAKNDKAPKNYFLGIFVVVEAQEKVIYLQNY